MNGCWNTSAYLFPGTTAVVLVVNRMLQLLTAAEQVVEAALSVVSEDPVGKSLEALYKSAVMFCVRSESLNIILTDAMSMEFVAAVKDCDQ